MSYLYWNDFVLQWQRGVKSIGGWSNPDNIPLYNDSGHAQLSSQFIPEPWWGNDGSMPLHSVVINYNPGEGKDNQKMGMVPTISSYAEDIVHSGILPKTNCWHCKYRAMPTLESLRRHNCISGPISVNNHLSLELIPWHMKEVNDSYWDYISQNASYVFDKVIRFAADESSRISNSILKSIVLLRMNEESIKRLLKEFQNVGKGSRIVSHKRATSSGNAFFLEFMFYCLPNNRFVALWGARTRNRLPQPADLDEILQSL